METNETIKSNIKFIKEKTMIISFQNGLGNYDEIAEITNMKENIIAGQTLQSVGY